MAWRPHPSTVVLVLLLSLAAATDAAGVYYCLESYNPVGQELQQVHITGTAARNGTRSSSKTGGQVARQCAAACDAAAECTGFRAVGPEVAGGGTCELLTNSSQSLPAALAFQGPSSPWPEVHDNLIAADRIALRSVSWMCWRQQQDWDEFGRATHNMIVAGNVAGDGKEVDHSDWCAFGVDVAGTNLRRDFVNITRPAQCDDICRRNATGCTFWIFVASRPEQTQLQQERNCFAKADVFKGENGWTGKPKADIWNADSQVTCFSNLVDWRHLGLVLSPSIKTINEAGSFYTVYPERVIWSEASATCRKLPNGQLAILDSQGLIDRVSQDLLATLPFQTGVRSAWVGAKGNNTAFNPDAPNVTDMAAEAQGGNGSLQARLPPRAQPDQPPESTLKWAGGAPVAYGLLRRPDTLTQLWTVHDVVWSQQYVPESSRDVCGRVMVQLPPTTGPVNPSSVLPGVWYYDCNKPAAFICQSSAAPAEPMSGREVTPSKVASADDSQADRAGSSLQPWKTALAVILPVLAMALLAYQVFRVYSRKMSRLPEMIRQQRKRALGQPRTGRMSLVMTDIQGFTKLMQGDADQTSQALLLHNNVIKHAVYQNVGWVVEQEGDSFSVVFHEAEDAVAFTLQVQQALLQQSWPRGVAYHDGWEGATTVLDCTTAASQQPDAAAAALAGTSLDEAPTAAAALGEVGTPQRSQPGSFSWTPREDAAGLAETSLPSSSSNSLQGLGAGAGVSTPRQGSGLIPPCLRSGKSSSFTVAGTAGKTLLHKRSRSLDNGSPTDQQHGDSTTGAVVSAQGGITITPEPPGALVVNTSGLQGLGRGQGRQDSVSSDEWGRALRGWGLRGHSPSGNAPSASASFATTMAGATVGGGGSGREKSRVGSRPRNLWLFQQLLSPRQEQGKLFSGLRVRMGVVTGEVERGQELKSSALYRSAQDVSGAAHGGQVLMDAATFTAVKEALWRLGAVGPGGLDYDALHATKSARHSMGGNGASSGCVGDGCLPGLMPGGSFRSGVSTITDGSHGLPSSTGSDSAVALDMGCYELLPPAATSSLNRHSNPTSPSSPGSNISSKKTHTFVQLWTKELGDKLVQQYQQYVQQQISSGGDLLHDLLRPVHDAGEGTDDTASCNELDEEAQAPYAPPRSLRKAASNKQQQAHSHGLGGGPAGLRQQQHSLSSSRSSSQTYSRSPSLTTGRARGGLPGGPRQQKDPSQGLVSRSASMTVPHSWQHMTSSLFGVGVMAAAGDKAGDRAGLGHDSHLSSTTKKPNLCSLLGYCSISAVQRPSVRLYQVVAPSLAGRAALFGQTLDLPPNWRVLDLPYFAAPGLSSESLLAAQAAAAEGGTPSTAGDGGPGLQEFGGLGSHRMPGQVSSDSTPGRLMPPGRSSSDVYHLSQQQQQPKQVIRGASSAYEASMLAALQPGAAVNSAPTTPAAAAAAAGAGGSAGRQGDLAGGHPGELRTASSPFLPAAQRRFSSGSADPDAAAAAAAAVAQAGDNTTSSSTLSLSQRPRTPGSAVASRLNSSSAHGGQLFLQSASTASQQQQALGALTSSSPAAGSMAQSLLVLRAASLQLNVAPSVLMGAAGGGHGDRRASFGGHRGARLAGPGRPLFPPVTILFAGVEGGAELLQFPALARSVHAMVHHLMLQLLRSFPGSYLVRAQQGDLKYMLAFTCPAAAVAWGLTLQEAALYLPYPQEVLGLGSCGVQLDEGGRLVFRGPRFQMGLSEGTPKIIMPDHLGRADYHGSFVNLAARYAVVAAQGGQLVTDVDLARQVLWHFKAAAAAAAGADAHTHTPSAPDGWTSNPSFTAPQSSNSSKGGVVPWASTEQQLAAGGSSSNSHVLVIRPEQSAGSADDITPVAAAAAAATAVGGGGSTAASTAVADVAVECCWLGSFLFKGNPSPVSMVSFGPTVLSGRQYTPLSLASSKGVRVLQRVGVMDRAVVRLPAAVEGFGPWEGLHDGQY